MKNFKLLLASTAILSTGALLANSADLSYTDSADFDARVELIRAAGITMINDTVNFGTLVQTGAAAPTGTATMDSNGAITFSGSGAVRDTAVATHVGRFDINIPEGYTATVTPAASVSLDNENGDIIIFTPTVNSDTSSYADGSNYIMHNYRVYGSLNLDNVPLNGLFQGSFTVSVIVKPE